MLSHPGGKNGPLRLFFVTFPSGIIVAADKYQPFVLLCKREDKAKIVNK
ncbi:hypothetical protein ENTCAN_06432 [Enterobacter cancerogenus ATCC 35316]|nr:hypothetical protein ENTCAN_06432 [Enterobacter cancerogenus ATCC 35316]